MNNLREYFIAILGQFIIDKNISSGVLSQRLRRYVIANKLDSGPFIDQIREVYRILFEKELIVLIGDEKQEKIFSITNRGEKLLSILSRGKILIEK